MSDIRQQVHELHERGLGVSDIAHRLQVAKATVHYHLRRLQMQPAEQAPKAQAKPHRRSVATRQLVEALLAQGLARAEIARRIGVSKSTVSYHARRLGAGTDERFGRRFDWSLIQAYYDSGHSVRECAKVFGFTTWSWHGAVQRGLITPRPGFKPLEELFAPNTRRGRGHLKQRLLRAGIKDGACEECGRSEWLAKPLTMALHHVNGDRLDNRIENLRLLCPNCHSQTDTYGGRNGRSGRAGSC